MPKARKEFLYFPLDMRATVALESVGMAGVMVSKEEASSAAKVANAVGSTPLQRSEAFALLARRQAQVVGKSAKLVQARNAARAFWDGKSAAERAAIMRKRRAKGVKLRQKRMKEMQSNREGK